VRIDFFANDGSPIGVIPQDIWGKGVGGAELALLTLTEELGLRGHEVWIYNNPREAVSGPVRFAHQREFYDDHHSDVFVLFRSPNPALLQADTGKKVFWSCDQQTVGNYTRDIFPHVDQVLTISEFHRKFLVDKWRAEPKKTVSLDLGIRITDYTRNVERVENRLIFCSVPDRGLEQLREAWRLIVDEIPDASLVITGDYTLWGVANPQCHRYRMMFAREHNVEYLGNIPRGQLIDQQLQAQILAFPCTYDELFCLAAAECQVAGAIPVTSTRGALETTNEWGVKLEGDPETSIWIGSFAKEIINILRSDSNSLRFTMRTEANHRFDIKRVVDHWEDLIL
jgi:glycosyltransferase involved in cell wall biosynthesis